MPRTVAEILDGPASEPSHANARARVPMTEAEARWNIRNMERHTRQKAARRRVAAMACGPLAGPMTDAARALYADYVAALA